MKGLGKSDSSDTQKLDEFRRIYQYFLDKTVPYAVPRWAGTLVLALMFAIRVYLTKGYFVVLYFVGCYILCLFCDFLSPLVTPEFDGAVLPTKISDEFKPFIRRLPEFKFWLSVTKAFLTAFVMTFFWIFNLPVFWPILLVVWVGLFAVMLKYHISCMVKYKYIPFSFGKPKYGRKKLSTAKSSHAYP